MLLILSITTVVSGSIPCPASGEVYDDVVVYILYYYRYIYHEQR